MTIQNLPTKVESQRLLEEHVQDEYQKLHALMVATAMEGYGAKFGEDPHLWFMAGYLHDLDFYNHPHEHPGKSLQWFKDWNYPEELIHAVEAHAYGYNGYTTEPQTKIAAALIACDEICGIFYAYRKMNPIPFKDIKVSSILKKLKDKGFAPNIKREDIEYGCEKLGVTIEEHVQSLIEFLSMLDK